MATKKAKSNASSSAPVSEIVATRPFANSPAPENCRLDPESALTILAESLLPLDAPKPVYSTLALANGKDAFAAQHVRPEFAWNPQMDLLWALGYPYCIILVDSGIPLAPMTEQLALWETSDVVVSPITLARGIFRGFEPVPRPLASAHLWALRAGKEVTQLTDEEWPDAVGFTPREEDAKEILNGVYEGYFQIAAYTLEAFLGPDVILRILLDLAEKHLTPEHNKRAKSALSAMPPLLIRTLPNLREEALSRVGAVHAAATAAGDKNVVGFTASLLFPVEKARGYPRHGAGYLAFTFGLEDLYLECVREAGPSSYVRAVFQGGLPVAKLHCGWFKKVDPQDLVTAYLCDYTTTFRGGMLPGFLMCLSKKDMRESVRLWFEAHREKLRPELLALQADPDFSALVAKGLKTLRW